MKKYIENFYTAPYIELDDEGYIVDVDVDVIAESDALADYGWDTIDTPEEFWNCFENLTRENLIWQEEDIEKFEKIIFESEDFENYNDYKKAIRECNIKIDWIIEYFDEDENEE